MKILIINSYIHHKNKIGIENILNYLQIEYKYGNHNDISNYDIIYSPSEPLDTSIYKNKKFIFGPHFSVYPDRKILNTNNIHKNSIYIQSSKWVIDLWIHEFNLNNIFKSLIYSDILIPLKVFPFPVDTNRFNSEIPNSNRTEIFIYYKYRISTELDFLKNFLHNKNISYKIFNYQEKYNENNYLNTLQNSKYGIILGCPESQGFAIEEALSCNVPLLVWNVKSRNQETPTINYDFPATSIPYWDNRCGEFFYEKDELDKTYNIFINKLNSYNPREFIIENLSIKKCSENFIKLVEEFKI